MHRLRSIRVRRAATLVPLAVLSAAWTASLVEVGATTSVAAPAAPAQPATSVPTEAIQVPASVSAPDEIAPGVRGTALDGTGTGAQEVVATASTSGIPAAALAAYQRAETVIDNADRSCHLTWQLVAAIGRVESNHGRFAGNVLDDSGIARPGIYGIPLNGRHGTTKVSDTDAGAFDRDSVWDRAVGPMQFIPSTWSVVGVDADGDGQRNPQDINDAALATAVYLCSGSDDLATTAGQRSAVYRYNHSNDYVDLVLQIMDAYASGDYTSVPNSVSAAGYIAPAPAPARDQQHPARPHHSAPQPAPQQPASPPASQPSTPPPSGGTGTGSGSGSGSGGGKGVLGIPGAPAASLPPAPSTGVKPVDDVLTYAQAVVQCTLDGYLNNLLSSTDPFDQCVTDYTTAKK